MGLRRRIGFDQVYTLAPTVMDDGRVVYIRWDYNDRSQVYTQAIFQMNPDGTGQTEYYGNNTFEPTNFFHPRGTIKKLRVVALRFREMYVGNNGSSGKGGNAGVVTPIAIGTGSWDVKVILGDATVHEDGSAMFEVPARTPVYFQALNGKNQAVQTMRSWSTLMPGETFSCVGCHEDKNEAPQLRKTLSLAMKAGPEKLKPFYGPPRGFSFPKQIQPILDKHCVKCHKAGGKAAKYLLTSETVHYKRSQRNWARSYLTLTGTPAKKYEPHEERGEANEIVNWINNSSEPTMIPPRYGGSTRSKLLLMNDSDTSPCPADIKLSREELDKLAAWIDMVVPYCGDYVEANAWSEDAMRRAKKRMALNKEAREIDLRNIREYIKAGQ